MPVESVKEVVQVDPTDEYKEFTLVNNGESISKNCTGCGCKGCDGGCKSCGMCGGSCKGCRIEFYSTLKTVKLEGIRKCTARQEDKAA